MKRFVEGTDRGQSTLFPAVLDDHVGEDNPVRAIDVFVDGLDLAKLGFDGVAPLATGRPVYHPGPLLKIYIYGYFNRVQSSRRLERECQRNVELVWLTRRDRACMFSRQEVRSCACPQEDFWHARRLRARSHRSISPNTISSEPIIAETSASMCPRLKKSIACRWANEGARILHL